MDRESYSGNNTVNMPPSDAAAHMAQSAPLFLSIIVDNCLCGVAAPLSRIFGRCAEIRDLGFLETAPDKDIMQLAVKKRWSAILTADMRDVNDQDMTRIARNVAATEMKASAARVFTGAHLGNPKRIKDGVAYLIDSVQRGELAETLASQPFLLHVDQSLFLETPGAGRHSKQLVDLCCEWQDAIFTAGTQTPRGSYSALLTRQGLQPGPTYERLLTHTLYQNAATIMLRDKNALKDPARVRLASEGMKNAICQVLGQDGKRAAVEPFKTSYPLRPRTHVVAAAPGLTACA
ncbi:MAG: hypothetical protein V4621_07130 [Pseudomonadota bacterium]